MINRADAMPRVSGSTPHIKPIMTPTAADAHRRAEDTADRRDLYGVPDGVVRRTPRAMRKCAQLGMVTLFLGEICGEDKYA